jgi:hypothetical protein
MHSSFDWHVLGGIIAIVATILVMLLALEQDQSSRAAAEYDAQNETLTATLRKKYPATLTTQQEIDAGNWR